MLVLAVFLEGAIEDCLENEDKNDDDVGELGREGCKLNDLVDFRKRREREMDGRGVERELRVGSGFSVSSRP